MFDTHLVIRTDNRSLQETPDAFNAISVNIANNPFVSRVINPFVLSVSILDSPISRHFVGVNCFRIRFRIVMNKLVQRCLVSVRNNLQANLALSLDCSNSNSFVALVAASHSPHLAADIGFIDFDNASQKLAVNLTHSGTDTMAEIPRCFVSNAKRSL